MKFLLILLSFVAFANSSYAEKPEFSVIIKNHKFEPDVIEVPVGEKFTLLVDNQDATPEEFESHDLHREKIINGNSTAKIFLGPLEAGEYKFFGEFNEDSAQGKIVAK